MKTLMIVFTVTAAISFVSCNNNAPLKENQSKMSQKDTVSIQQKEVTGKDVKTVEASFTGVDPAVTAFIKTLVQNYLDIKNALTNSNESGAVTASEKMSTVMKGFDKSLLTADQKKVYDDIEDDLKEHTEHIAKSKIDHQRHHFAMMSDDMYDLVKAFGAGMTLYHEHCPMYNDNKGAEWLSETKEIRNPYYGEKMMTCGSVVEIFK